MISCFPGIARCGLTGEIQKRLDRKNLYIDIIPFMTQKVPVTAAYYYFSYFRGEFLSP